MNSSTKSNALNSHHGEKPAQRADKMGGWYSKHWKGFSKKFIQRFTNKKRRQLFKQNVEDKI